MANIFEHPEAPPVPVEAVERREALAVGGPFAHLPLAERVRRVEQHLFPEAFEEGGMKPADWQDTEVHVDERGGAVSEADLREGPGPGVRRI